MSPMHKLRPLLIFNGTYERDSQLNREGVNNTAKLMKEAFLSMPGLNLECGDTFLENVSYVQGCEEIQRFVNALDSESEIPLIYFCGHGFPDFRNNTVHLAFSDTTKDTASKTGYDAKELIQLLQQHGQKRYILILDCCHGGYMNALGEHDEIILSSYLEDGYVHISSAKAMESCVQIEIDGQYQVPFSYSLADILSDPSSFAQAFSMRELYDKVKETVERITKDTDYRASCSIQCSNDFCNEKIFKIYKQGRSEYGTSAFGFSKFFQMEKLKILLVKTSIKYPIKYDDFGIPLGLWLLKSELSTAGHNFEVDIYDERLALHKCGDDVSKRNAVVKEFERIVQNYDVVGISVSTSEVFPAIKKFRIAKKYDKITFVGGIFTSSNEDFLLDSEVVDYVVPGVASRPLCELLSKLYREKEKGRLGSQLLTISGVASKNVAPVDFAWGPTQLPSMRINLWNEIVDVYGNYIDGKVDIYSSRGCDKNCIFCSINRESRQVVSRKSFRSTIEEINLLKSLGITYFSFKDENFLSDFDRMKQILDEVKGPGIKFKIRARYDDMRKINVTLEQLRDYGVHEIQYGIESHELNIRKNVSKGDYHDSDLIDFIRKHTTIGITANCSFILGIEGEDIPYYDGLLQFIKQIYDESSQPKIYINFLTPHPYNSKFSLSKYSLVTKDLNYFTHKFPICIADNANRAKRDKMLQTYDAIVKHSNSELYNPLTETIPTKLKNSFLRGDKCKVSQMEYPKKGEQKNGKK